MNINQFLTCPIVLNGERSTAVAINDRRVDDDFPRPGERQGYKVAGTALNLELANGRHVRLVLEDYF